MNRLVAGFVAVVISVGLIWVADVHVARLITYARVWAGAKSDQDRRHLINEFHRGDALKPIAVGILAPGSLGCGVGCLIVTEKHRLCDFRNNRFRICSYGLSGLFWFVGVYWLIGHAFVKGKARH